jgi:hypothetical protein
MGDVVFMLLFFWLALLPLAAGVSQLIARSKLYKDRGFRRGFRLVAGAMPLFALAFGLCTGYFNACLDHPSWSGSAPGGLERWCYKFWTFYGEPGKAIAEAFGGGWPSRAEWCYRCNVTLCNGLFWGSGGVAFGPTIQLMVRATTIRTRRGAWRGYGRKRMKS